MISAKFTLRDSSCVNVDDLQEIYANGSKFSAEQYQQAILLSGTNKSPFFFTGKDKTLVVYKGDVLCYEFART